MTPYDPSNIFGRIIRGELPAHKVYEDDATVAIMDVFPQSRGHLLVIPKAQSRNLLDADAAVLANAVAAVQKLARAVQRALSPAGIRIAQFNEAPAGQSVFHLHFHVIPVYDGQGLRPHGAGRAPDAELAELAKAIAGALS